jgi:hypothetical protein
VYGWPVLQRSRQPEEAREDERARRAAPAPALRFGSREWASAMGSAAVARIARQATAEEAVEEPPVAESEAPAPEPEAEADAAEAPPDDVAAEAQPEAAAALDALPEDQLPE